MNYFTKIISIELFHISKEGKLIISITKHDEKYVSIMNQIMILYIPVRKIVIVIKSL